MDNLNKTKATGADPFSIFRCSLELPCTSRKFYYTSSCNLNGFHGPDNLSCSQLASVIGKLSLWWPDKRPYLSVEPIERLVFLVRRRHSGLSKDVAGYALENWLSLEQRQNGSGFRLSRRLGGCLCSLVKVCNSMGTGCSSMCTQEHGLNPPFHLSSFLTSLPNAAWSSCNFIWLV